MLILLLLLLLLVVEPVLLLIAVVIGGREDVLLLFLSEEAGVELLIIRIMAMDAPCMYVVRSLCVVKSERFFVSNLKERRNGYSEHSCNECYW